MLCLNATCDASEGVWVVDALLLLLIVVVDSVDFWFFVVFDACLDGPEVVALPGTCRVVAFAVCALWG